MSDPIITHKVLYRPNPAYKGTYLVDKMGKGGIHGTFGPENGGLDGANEAAEKCRDWFTQEKIADEHMVNKQVKVAVKIVKHDNVIVWVETYKDGIRVDLKKEAVPA